MTVKNTTIFVNIINNLSTTCFGLIRPSSGWNTASEENYLFDLNAGGKGGTRSRLQIQSRKNNKLFIIFTNIVVFLTVIVDY